MKTLKRIGYGILVGLGVSGIFFAVGLGFYKGHVEEATFINLLSQGYGFMIFGFIIGFFLGFKESS